MWKMIILGITAGLFVGLGGQTVYSVFVGTDLSGPAKYLGGCAFSVGLMIIVIAGAELFTGNVLILMSVLARRVYWYEMVKDWLIIWPSNFIGCIIYAGMVQGGGLNGYPGEWSHSGEVICSIAVTKTSLKTREMFFRGIGANMLVCLAVILCTASKSAAGKILACIFPIASFVTIGFEHSIANMYLFSVATMIDCPPAQRMYWTNLGLVTLGNICGAAILALIYWICYIHGSSSEKEEVPYDPRSPHTFHHSVEVSAPHEPV